MLLKTVFQATSGKLHWNYFLALEHDMQTVSRYVEFAQGNFDVYSIELAHLLFAAASEVDVISKLLCAVVAPNAPRGNINDYRAALTSALPQITSENVFVPRYALTLTPWINWAATPQINPDWWKSYNNVKHERNLHFNEATLKNALNAMGALLVVTFYYYLKTLPMAPLTVFSERDITNRLEPETTLFRLRSDYYYDTLAV